MDEAAIRAKAVRGYWACSNCDNVEFYEREIKCWKCGKGEMLYQDKEALRSFIEQATAAFKRVGELEQDSKRLDLIDEHLLIIHPPEPSKDEFDDLWVVCNYTLPRRVDCLAKNKDLRQAIDKAMAKAGGE